MKTKTNYLLLASILLIQSCSEQKTPQQEIHNDDFNWTITIPENFESVSSADWEKIQNRGADAIEKTYDTLVVNQTKTIFVFRNDLLNYFESNYQEFNPADGTYPEQCKLMEEVLITTFQSQLPDSKIDTASTTEKISGLEFHTFKIKMVYPNKMVMNVHMFSRLFDNKEFTVNIMYVDEAKGQKMLSAWKESKFQK